MLNSKELAAQAVIEFRSLAGDFFFQNSCEDVETNFRDLIRADIGHPQMTTRIAPEHINISTRSYDIYTLTEFLRDLAEYAKVFKPEYSKEISGVITLLAEVNIKDVRYYLNRSFNQYVYADDDLQCSFHEVVNVFESFQKVAVLLRECDRVNKLFNEEEQKGGELC